MTTASFRASRKQDNDGKAKTSKKRIIRWHSDDEVGEAAALIAPGKTNSLLV